jgi:serine/threonine-protein kinase RsbW
MGIYLIDNKAGEEMKNRAVLRVQAERSQLAIIRKFVAEATASSQMAPEDIEDLVQAVDEAATNIIVHGYRDSSGTIEIEIINRPKKVMIYLRDHARPFDSTSVPEPDINLPLEKRPIGGLGIHLIRHCVDEFQHHYLQEGGNEITLMKQKRTKGES